MAKLNGLKALFTSEQIKKFVDSKQQEFEDKMVQTAIYLGEQFVNKARSVRTYQDRTGNLRSSIGYIVLKDGKLLQDNFQTSSRASENEGVKRAKAFAEEVSTRYPSGIILIGVAGMEYAAYVEAKNFDVITSSAPTSKDFKEVFSEVKF